MKERPILFSAPMVRAILEGRKTQTRRIIKPQGAPVWVPSRGWLTSSLSVETQFTCPYGAPGDQLWARETAIIAPKRFATPDDTCVKDADGDARYIQYLASQPNTEAAKEWYKLKTTPSIFMPRWASRITLEVTGVRVERLQDISEEDAAAEGVSHSCDRSDVDAYQELWNSINLAPSPILKGKEIVSYVAYPWSLKDFEAEFPGVAEAGVYRGKPITVHPNPWVWVIEFRRL